MSRFGFVGPSYTLPNITADAQRCVNWYPQSDESGMGKSAMTLEPTPGLSLFAQVGGAAQVRGIWSINGRVFAVIDAELYECLSNGSLNPIGAVGNDGNLVSMVACPQQLLVASVGNVYVYQLQTASGYENATLAPTGTLTAGQFFQIPSATFPGPVTQVGLCDSFFIALIASTEQYFVSTQLDATDWTDEGSKIISTFPDNVVSMVIDHREIWLLGAKSSDPQYDSGNIFPFDSVPGGFIEQGCGAQFATVQADNSIFWLGARNDQGGLVGWRANGYTPQRVSNHAAEAAWDSYPVTSDARAFSYSQAGHTFWHINFPSAQATWVYDVATGVWHERGFWNSNTGVYQAALPQCHTYNFGFHLVGDRASGSIYKMGLPIVQGGGWNFVTDNNKPIRRLRRAPYISKEEQWMFYNYFQLDMSTGVGPQPPLTDGAGNPRGPKVTLSWSDDGWRTTAASFDLDCGQVGKYNQRVIKWRLGRGRHRGFQIVAADPVPYWLTDAFVNEPTEMRPQKRLPKQYAEVS